jgi:predicted ester cyclase
MNARAERVEEARRHWNEGDLDAYLTLYDENIRLHVYSHTPDPMDKAGATAFYRGIWASLAADGRPSPELVFFETMVDGDLYCCRFTMSGVHQAEFLGMPASGRRYTMDGITIMRFSGDQVVERWLTADFLAMMVQIGALSAPA